MFKKIATGCHGFFKENLRVLQSFCPGNTVPFLDQEQNKSPKNAQNNANKWHLLATVAGFFISKKPLLEMKF